jgi:hypothetical membrane protein
MRVLLLGGVIGPALFAAVVVSVAALQPGYSHITNFISELGASGMERAVAMNYAGFVPSGLFLAGFGVSLAFVLPRHALLVVGSLLVTIFGVGIAASGIVSCDAGCPQTTGSLENIIHNRIAPISFVSLILAAALLGYYFRRLPGMRVLSLYSLVTSVLGLIFMAALVVSLDQRALTGLWQRLLLATLFLWCAAVAVATVRYASSHRNAF